MTQKINVKWSALLSTPWWNHQHG